MAVNFSNNFEFTELDRRYIDATKYFLKTYKDFSDWEYPMYGLSILQDIETKQTKIEFYINSYALSDVVNDLYLDEDDNISLDDIKEDITSKFGIEVLSDTYAGPVFEVVCGEELKFTKEQLDDFTRISLCPRMSDFIWEMFKLFSKIDDIQHEVTELNKFLDIWVNEDSLVDKLPALYMGIDVYNVARCDSKLYDYIAENDKQGIFGYDDMQCFYIDDKHRRTHKRDTANAYDFCIAFNNVSYEPIDPEEL